MDGSANPRAAAPAKEREGALVLRRGASPAGAEKRGGREGEVLGDLDQLVVRIAARDAERRARFKAPLREPSLTEQRLHGLQQQFSCWCHDVLEIEVRTADVTLARVGYRLKQTIAPLPNCRTMTGSAEEAVGQTTIVLERNGDRHLLTVTLQGDGTVMASDGTTISLTCDGAMKLVRSFCARLAA